MPIGKLIGSMKPNESFEKVNLRTVGSLRLPVLTVIAIVKHVLISLKHGTSKNEPAPNLSWEQTDLVLYFHVSNTYFKQTAMSHETSKLLR